MFYRKIFQERLFNFLSYLCLLQIGLLFTIKCAESEEIHASIMMNIAPDEHVWTWSCLDQKCKKFPVKEMVQLSGNEYKMIQREVVSFNRCKLLCGGGTGTLWPLPTGDIDIKGPVVAINSSNIVVNIKFQSDDKELNPLISDFAEALSNNFKEKILSYKLDETCNKVNSLKKVEAEILDEITISTTSASEDEVRVELKYPCTTSQPSLSSIINDKPDVYSLVVEGTIKDPKHLSINLDTDESYTINLVHNSTSNILKAEVNASTYFGLRHGFETLHQMIVYDNIYKELIMPFKIQIADKPVFPYRGITLDTSRNFISVKGIKRTIDAMAANKLNIFHWHITDTHSFPLELPTYPQFAQYGSYGPNMVYKPSDVRDIVRYATSRGVKIVPEFDAPAHVGEGWQWTPEELVLCFNKQPWIQYCVEPPCGIFNPTKELLYELLHAIYRDMFDLFGVDSFFHLGGDEVQFQCWNSTENVTNWMKDRGWDTDTAGFKELWNYFQQRALELAMRASANVGNQKPPHFILWTSGLTDSDSLQHIDQSQYIIHIWTQDTDETVNELISRGYKVIFSNYNALYLDCGFGGWVTDGNNWCSPYKAWQTIYMNDPVQLLSNSNYSTDALHKQVLGQVSPLWTEQADDESLDGRFWPRASALAERTWTNPKTNWTDAEYRMLFQRDRMVHYGIKAEALQPAWCRQNEGSCPISSS